MKKPRVPSPALVVSILALFIALGGTSLAATSYINGRHIRPHSIPKNRLTSAAVKSLKGSRGATGAQGSKGDKGDQGPTGPSNTYFGHSLTATPSTSVPAGDYVVSGEASFSAGATGGLQACQIWVNGGTIAGSNYSTDYATIPANGDASIPDQAIVHLTATATITNNCSGVSTHEISESVTAVRIGSVTP